MQNDTIAAIASPAGVGAVSLIRVSGPEAFIHCSQLLKGNRDVAKIEDRKASLAKIHNAKGEVIDDTLLTPFHGPKSFTGENVVEIACHGGILVTRRVLQRLLELGIRSAEPGEFSKRAFENGKLDLTQAEAIMDLISAQTDLALRAAHEQLQGKLGDASEGLRQLMIELVAHVEAYIDFPEEDIDPATGDLLLQKVDAITNGIDKMLSTAEQGKILREGVRTVICGEPNVGKSSLLNALLGYDRAIVSDIAGTTRDTVEEVVNLNGIPLRLIDTAGVRDSKDAIEQQGIERSEKQIELADLIIEVVDGSKPGKRLLEKDQISGRHHILIANKSDLGTDPVWQKQAADAPAAIAVSCMQDSGMEAISEAITDTLSMSQAVAGGHIIAINARHQACLNRAKTSLLAARQGLADNLGSEFVSLDLRDSLEAVGEVAGRVDTEEIFDEIFGTFCIGK
ncbi:tRNA uridine-5-carboxymethylaminomethyl(34) synthesis GTPase MnmE [Akkermansiaceae bacterium]|nr:tRNA uridine-5-carboxymethylaminomethyl(34) synthesis GTPase MnmE [Akkermansiaceae bacterium]